MAAKDNATGKKQNIRIEASSGLSDQEIEKMRQDAKTHAEEDEKKRAQIEKRNQADSLAYSTEKNLKEYGDKIPAEKKAKVEAALERLKEVRKNDESPDLDSALEQLNQAWSEAAEDMYKAQQAAASQEEANAGAGAGQEESAADDSVDADFEVIDEDEESSGTNHK